MPPDPDKRKLRELKRAIKKRGGKARRRTAKHTLAADPEAAPHADDTVGRHTSAWLNGLDRKPAARRVAGVRRCPVPAGGYSKGLRTAGSRGQP